MNKLLCIVGATATGKTKKAIELYHQTPSILVSADSRQVYRGMDIVTGKDHPHDIPIFGLDLVDSDQSCSVSVWHEAVMPHIREAWDAGKQVIVVGGTGLYVKALTDGIDTMCVPMNYVLRQELETLSINELQEKLKEIDIGKFDSMNRSDSLNPRRLIRAIEVSSSPVVPLTSSVTDLESSMIGLKYFDNSNYRSKVRERVLSRLENGALEETKSLLTKYGKNLQSMSAIGYKSIINFIENRCTQEQMVAQWVIDELSYAKRQLTWFRKQPVIWYDVEKVNGK